MAEFGLGNSGSQERLLVALAEQLKVPLQQIARHAELSRRGPAQAKALLDIEDTAQLGLTLIDNYVLATQLAQATLMLEPVSLSAVLHDTAVALEPVARQYNCELELSISGKYEPVMAHRSGLRAALVSMGHVFIEAGHQSRRKKPVIQLAAHRGKNGIVGGIFSETESLSAEVYRRARQLYGRSRQPLQDLTSTSGAGIFVADTLLASMDSRLRVASHRKSTGLAATFIPSRQLNLI